jgi:hypothetical protein
VDVRRKASIDHVHRGRTRTRLSCSSPPSRSGSLLRVSLETTPLPPLDVSSDARERGRGGDGGPDRSRSGLFELLDPRGHHLRQAPGSGSAPIEPSDEMPVHEHGVALGDPVDGARADRGVPRRDRRRRLPASGTESRSSVTSSPDGIRRWTGSAATVPASTTTLSLCYYGGATPSTLSVVRGSPTGYEADAELIYVTGREEMQVVDHAVVTAHE